MIESNQLVSIQNNQVVVTSTQIAEHFGKRHDSVIRHIEDVLGGVLEKENTQRMFYKTTYIHEQNKQEYPMYVMNRDGFSLLIMGFTGQKALQWKLKYIEAFNKMEALLKEQQAPYKIPQTYSEALRLAADLQEQIEHDKPKVQFVDKFVTSDNLLCLRDVLKNLGVRERSTIAFLIDKKVLYRGKGGLRPMAEYQHKGYFEVKTATFNEKNVVRTLVTPAGHTWLANYLRKHHLIP